MRRPPLTLWRYVLLELWRLVLLTTCILVTVLSFAASVRFLAEGRLGPVETVRLMFLAMPTMLQYALPFAAGFGATLAYHRICTDNELTGMYAAGISHRSVLGPAVVTGLALACVLFSLSNLVVPRFLRSMEELITRDAARFIMNSIERKEAVRMENTLLYADLVRRSPDTGNGAYERLYLQGVFVVDLDKNGQVKFQASAKEADVWLTRIIQTKRQPGLDTETSEAVTQVIVRSRGLVGQKAGEGAMQHEAFNFSKTIPNAFRDDPKFLSWSELRAIRKSPESLNIIDSRRRVLASHLAERATTDQLSASLASAGKVVLLTSSDTPLVIHASSISWDATDKKWVMAPPSGAANKPQRIRIERESENGKKIVQEAGGATMRTAVDPNAVDHPVTLTVSFSDLKTISRGGVLTTPTKESDPGTPASGQIKTQIDTNLTLTDDPVGRIMNDSSATLLTSADTRLERNPTDGYIADPTRELRRRIADLMREITSKQQERWAASGACLVMILLGAVMAIKLRSKLPLAVYLWAFFPALATVISISAGQQMIHSKGLSGLPIIWGGVGLLLLHTFKQIRIISRN